MEPPVFESIAGPVTCPKGCGESIWLNMIDQSPWNHECDFDEVDVAEAIGMMES